MSCDDLRAAADAAHLQFEQSLAARTTAQQELEAADQAVAEAEATLAAKQSDQQTAQSNMTAAQEQVNTDATAADDAYTEWIECERNGGTPAGASRGKSRAA